MYYYSHLKNILENIQKDEDILDYLQKIGGNKDIANRFINGWMDWSTTNMHALQYKGNIAKMFNLDFSKDLDRASHMLTNGVHYDKEINDPIYINHFNKVKDRIKNQIDGVNTVSWEKNKILPTIAAMAKLSQDAHPEANVKLYRGVSLDQINHVKNNKQLDTDIVTSFTEDPSVAAMYAKNNNGGIISVNIPRENIMASHRIFSRLGTDFDTKGQVIVRTNGKLDIDPNDVVLPT